MEAMLWRALSFTAWSLNSSHKRLSTHTEREEPMAAELTQPSDTCATETPRPYLFTGPRLPAGGALHLARVKSPLNLNESGGSARCEWHSSSRATKRRTTVTSGPALCHETALGLAKNQSAHCLHTLFTQKASVSGAQQKYIFLKDPWHLLALGDCHGSWHDGTGTGSSQQLEG
ncbi:hypothetical protein INR49_024539 [Caranx melampygus]|nr:hypothetical protein INR49_024539 [Caranx melampygus]